MNRHATSFFWLGLESIWYPALMLLATPYLLTRLGEQEYGYWMLVNTVIAFGQLFVFGSSVATSKCIAEANAHRPQTLIAVCRSATGLSISVGAAVSVLIVLFAIVSGLFSQRSGGVFLTLMAAGLAFFEQLDVILSAVLRGLERFSVSSKVDAVGKCLQIGTACAVASWSGSTLLLILSTYLLFGIVRVGLKVFSIKASLGFFPFPPSLADVSSLLSISQWGWIQGLIGGAMFVVDRLLVAKVLGPAELSKFVLALTIPQQLNATLVAAVSFVLPRVSASLSKGKVEQTRIAAMKVLWLSLGILVAGLVAVIGLNAWSQELFLFWLGRHFDPSFYAVFFNMTLAFYFLCINAPSYFFLTAIGNLRQVSWLVCSSGLIGILAVVLGAEFGETAGASWGRVVYGVFSLSLLIPVMGLAFARTTTIGGSR